MLKNDLLKKVKECASCEYALEEIDDVLVSFAEVVYETLKNEDDKIKLSDLGTFQVKHVPERKGKSALNGKEWCKPAHRELVFKPTSTKKEI